MALHTIHVISEGWKDMDTQRLLLQHFFLLAAISKCWGLFIVTLLIYPQGWWSSLPSTLPGRCIFFFLLSFWYSFLIESGKLLFHCIKPLHPILFLCMLGQWRPSSFWPGRCPNCFLEDRPLHRNQVLGSWFSKLLDSLLHSQYLLVV